MIKSKKTISSLLIATVMFAGSAMAQSGIEAAKPHLAPAKSDIHKKIALLPDLRISNVELFTNNVFRANVQVANYGPGESAPCILMLQLGCSSNLNEYKKFSYTIPALKATKPGSWPDPASQETIVITSPIAFNVSNIRLTADYQNVVKEQNEKNNIWTKNNCVK
jgi:hypothetical protein